MGNVCLIRPIGAALIATILAGGTSGCILPEAERAPALSSPDGSVTAYMQTDWVLLITGPLQARVVAQSFHVKWHPTGQPLLPASVRIKPAYDWGCPWWVDMNRLVFSPDGRRLAVVLGRDVIIVDRVTRQQLRLTDCSRAICSFDWLGPTDVGYGTAVKVHGYAQGSYSSTDLFDITFYRRKINPLGPPGVVNKLRGTHAYSPRSPQEPQYVWLPDGTAINSETGRKVFGSGRQRGDAPFQVDPRCSDDDLIGIVRAHPNLTAIDLSGCRNISKLGTLTRLSDLTSLEFRTWKNLGDLSPLAELRQLTMLDLRGNENLTDLSPLGQLSTLRKIGLPAGITNTDLARVVADHPHLTALYLTGCRQITDLSPLAQLKDLTDLDLSGCPFVSDLSPLAGLKKLRKLNLYCCFRVDDISPLAGLTALGHLDLHACDQKDLKPLAKLTALEWLDLWDFEGRDLSPIVGLTRLTGLNLGYCEAVVDLKLLAGMTDLAGLNLDRCRVLNLSALATLKRLRVLNLQTAAISRGEIAELHEALPSCRIVPADRPGAAE